MKKLKNIESAQLWKGARNESRAGILYIFSIAGVLLFFFPIIELNWIETNLEEINLGEPEIWDVRWVLLSMNCHFANMLYSAKISHLKKKEKRHIYINGLVHGANSDCQHTS